ncbi:hypothetical protein EsH8_IV_000443 [Colletotrichum jinshuiense]
MDVNIKTALEGVIPFKTGTTILNAWDSSKTSNTEPVKIFGVSGPDGTDALNSCTAVAQRGYIKVEDAGSYTLSIDVPDDLMEVAGLNPGQPGRLVDPTLQPMPVSNKP